LRKAKVKGEGAVEGVNHENGKPPSIIEHIPKVEDSSESEEPWPKKPRIDNTGELDEDELFGNLHK